MSELLRHLPNNVGDEAKPPTGHVEDAQAQRKDCCSTAIALAKLFPVVRQLQGKRSAHCWSVPEFTGEAGDVTSFSSGFENMTTPKSSLRHN
jgi:hypothetical protein